MRNVQIDRFYLEFYFTKVKRSPEWHLCDKSRLLSLSGSLVNFPSGNFLVLLGAKNSHHRVNPEL